MYHSFTYFSHITTKLMKMHNYFITKFFISNNKNYFLIYFSFNVSNMTLKEKWVKLRIYEVILMLKHDVTINPNYREPYLYFGCL